MKTLVDTGGKVLYESDKDTTVKCLLEQAVKQRVKLTNLNLVGADLAGVHLKDEYILRADFTGANFEGCYIENMYFRGCSFKSANFNRARIVDSDFYNQHMGLVSLKSAIIVRSNFKMAYLSGANTEDLYVKECCFREANFSSCVLENIDFEDSDLKRATVGKSSVKGTTVKESDYLTIRPDKKNDVSNVPIIVYDVSGEGSFPVYCANYYLRKGRVGRVLKKEYFTSEQKIESFAKFYKMTIVEKNSRKSLSKVVIEVVKVN